MPYVSVRSSQHIDDDKAERLQKEIGRIMSVIPGKNIDNTMIQIMGDVRTFMSGKPVNATACELRLLGKAPKEKKKEFVGEMSRVITAELGELHQLYINIQEFAEWGTGATYKEV